MQSHAKKEGISKSPTAIISQIMERFFFPYPTSGWNSYNWLRITANAATKQSGKRLPLTVIQEFLKVGQKYFTVPRAQERVRERASKRVSSADERVTHYFQPHFMKFWITVQSLHFRPWKIFRQGAILRQNPICRLCPDEILLPSKVCFQSKYFVQT